MRFVLLLAALVSACDTSTTTVSDFGVVLPGCRAPSACWRINCPCNFATLDDCLVCDPNKEATGVCTCGDFSQDGSIDVECVERAQVCVGRAATTCNTLCVRAGQSCMLGAGDPPNQVASVPNGDGGPGIERRCPYADDVCCD